MLKKFIKEIFKTAVVTTIFGFPFRADASQTLKQFFTSQLKFYTAITTLSYISAKSSGDTANRNLGIKRAITNPIAPRNIVYGKTRVGGTIVQRTLTAKSASTKNVLHQVIALAGHEINNITKIYIDAGKGIKELDLSDTNDFVSATENSTTVFRCVDPEFANSDNDEAYTGGSLIKLAFEKGDQTTANGYAVAQMSSSSAWSTDHKMLGIAYIYINCIYDTEKFTQIPSFSFEIEGKKVFDPVSSSTVYSTNPALIIRDYLMDSTYGFGATATEINDAVTGAGFVKARSDCNDSVSITSGTESRYTLNGQFTSTEEPQTVLETMLSACAGQLLYNNGVFSLFVGKERTASGTITDDKILEPIQIQTKFSGRELANGVKATYVRPSDEYIAAEITPYKDSTYLTQDTPSGKAQADYENFLNLSFPYTQSSFTAQRLARIALDYQRQNQTLSVLVPLEFLSHQVGDIVNLDNDRLGYSGKDFEIVGMSFEFVGEQYLALRLSLKEYSTTVFNNITYVADPTLPSPPDSGDNTVSSPTGLALAEFTKDSQVRLHFIRASWTNNLDDKIVTTEVAYKKSTDSNFDAADVSYPSNSFSFYVEPATTYNVKVRHISNTGVSSAYTGTVNLTTSGGQVTLTTGTVAGITIESGKLYQGTGTFNNSNTGFFVDSSGQFSLKDKLSFNGTTLNISGNLTVENTINANKIVVDGINLDNLISASTQAGSIYLTEFTGIKIATAGGTSGYPPLLRLQDDQGTNTFTDITQSTQLNIRARNDTAKGKISFQGVDSGGTPVNYGGFDASGNFEIGLTDVIDASRNLTNIGTISSGAITANTGASSAIPLIIGSGSSTNYTLQRWITSAHSGSSAYILAYGASHSSQAGNFAMKNVVSGGEIFFELASNVEPLRLTSTGATFAGTISSGNITTSGSSPTYTLQDSDGTNQLSTLAQDGGSFILTARNNTSNGNIIFKGNNGSSVSEYARFNSAGNFTTQGNITVGGNLTVSGTTTTINTTNLDVADKNITLNFGSGDTSSNANGAGITIQDAVSASTDATILWDSTTDRFDFSHDIHLPDGAKFIAGNSADINIRHSTNSFIENFTGNLRIINYSDDSDITFESDNGAGGVQTYFFLDGSAEQVVFEKSARFTDNDKAIFGTGSDLEIYHDGSNSYIWEKGTGNLILRATDFRLQDSSGNSMAVANSGGGVGLYHNAAIKLDTTSSGINVTGSTVTDGITSDGSIAVSGDDRNINFDSGTKIIGDHSIDGLQIRTQNTDPIVLKTNGNNVRYRIDSSGNFQVQTTTIIDQSRNLTNIGTISSGVISIGTDTGVAFNSAAYLKIQPTGGNAFINIKTGTSNNAGLLLGDTDDNYVGGLIYNNSTNALTFNSGNATALTLDNSQNATFAGNVNIALPSGSVGSLTIKGGNSTVTAVGEVNSKIDFGSNDASVNSSGNIGGSIQSITEYNNGAWTGLAFFTFEQGSSGLREVVRMSRQGHLNLKVGDLQINSTSVIDTSRNLTNIGSISSTGLVTIDANGNGNTLHIHDDSTSGQPGMAVTTTGSTSTSTQTFYAKQYGSAVGVNLFGQSIGGKAFVGTEGSASGGLLIGTVTADNIFIGTNSTLALEINSSQNATFAGTISSGAITSTGLVTADELSVTNDSTFNGGIDATGQTITSGSITSSGDFIGDTFGTSTNKITWSIANNARIFTNGLERFRIDSSGRLGLGTSSPAEGLHVVGDIRTAGSTYGIRLDSSNSSGPQLEFGTSSNLDAYGTIGQRSSQFKFTTFNRDFHFNNNGTTNLYIDVSENKVGIGTSSPARLLESNSNASDVPQIRAAYNSTNYLDIKHNLINAVSSGGNDQLQLQTAGTTGLTIDVNQRVGIGTNAPSFELEVAGNIGMDNKLYHNDDHNTYIEFTADTQIFRTGGTDRVTINNTGVGIGTSSPSANLHLKSTDAQKPIIQLESTAASGADTYIRYGDSSENYSYALGIDDSGNTFRLAYDGTSFDGAAVGTNDLLTITSSGNLGINTNAPAEKIHINGSSSEVALRIDTTNADPKIRLTTLGQQDWSIGVDYSDSGKFKINESGNVGTLTALTIDANRNIGIGTVSPNFLLDVEGTGSTLARLNSTSGSALFQISVPDTTSICDINFGDTGHSQRGQIRYRHNGDSLAFSTAQTEALRIDSSQRVGIGTTAPAHLLDVNGSGRINGLTFGINGATRSITTHSDAGKLQLSGV